MAKLSSLLKRLEALHRQQNDIEHEIADVRRQIVASANTSKPRAKRSTKAEMIEVVRSTVNVLRDAGEPLPRREIASRLGIEPWAATYRLQKAIALGFVEKASTGRYRVVAEVAAL
jgi:hypothetical protein